MKKGAIYMKNFWNTLNKIFGGLENEQASSINIVQELDRIIKLTSPEVDPLTFQFSRKSWDKEKIIFENKDKNIIKRIPLKKVVFIEKDSHGYYKWEGDYKEYRNVYYNSFSLYIKRSILPIYNLLNSLEDNSFYNINLINFEITVLTVANTVKECIDYNGYVSDEVEKKCCELLDEFIKAVNIRKKEMESLEQLEIKAVHKSLIERLDNEVEYVNKFIKKI